MRIFRTAALTSIVVLSFTLEAAPRSLKIISRATGTTLSYFQSENGNWILQQRVEKLAPKRLSLAKLDQARLFEDLRRSVLQYKADELRAKAKPCLGAAVELELGGFENPTSRELCLSSVRDKAFYGQLRSRLDEAQGKPGSGRRFFK